MLDSETETGLGLVIIKSQPWPCRHILWLCGRQDRLDWLIIEFSVHLT